MQTTGEDLNKGEPFIQAHAKNPQQHPKSGIHRENTEGGDGHETQL